MKEIIEIPLSRTKNILHLSGAAAFVLFGLFFILSPGSFVSPVLNSEELIIIIGLASTIFFGFCLYIIVIKFFDKSPGITLNESGIIDNLSAASVGLIEWEDIKEIKSIKIASSYMLMVMTYHPEKYIERAKNGLARTTMRLNYRMYGSPLFFSATALQIKHHELESLLKSEIEKRNR